jgi:protein TonB
VVEAPVHLTDTTVTVIPDLQKPPPPDPKPVVTKPDVFKPTTLIVPPPPIPMDNVTTTVRATTDITPQPPIDITPRQQVETQPPAVTARAPVIQVANCARPEYPAMAARAEATGTTRIAFTVDATGRVAGAQILQSAGASREHKLLDRAAVDALSKCPFQPGLDAGGHPVGGSATVEYAWTLN